jgi:hypothetical protein
MTPMGRSFSSMRNWTFSALTPRPEASVAMSAISS